VNWLDATFFVIITFGTINGLRKGLVLSLFGLLGLAIAFVTASKGYSFGVTFLMDTFSFPHFLANILSFVVIWFLVYLLIMTVGKELHQLAINSFLAPLNLVGGMLFGALKGYLIILMIVYLLLSSFLSKSIMRHVIRESLFVNLSRPFVELIRPYVSNQQNTKQKFQIKKFISKRNKELDQVEESMDMIKNVPRMYKKISNDLDF